MQNTDAYIAKFPPLECPPTNIFFSGYLLAIFSKYFTDSVCDATKSLKLILKSSFQPTIVLSVPLYATYIVLSGNNIVTAENCFSASGSILFTKPVNFRFPNLSLFASLGNKSMSSACKILPVVPCSFIFRYASLTVISSFSFTEPSNGKYDNLAKIKLSISLNSTFSKLISLQSK